MKPPVVPTKVAAPAVETELPVAEAPPEPAPVPVEDEPEPPVAVEPLEPPAPPAPPDEPVPEALPVWDGMEDPIIEPVIIMEPEPVMLPESPLDGAPAVAAQEQTSAAAD